MIKFNFIIIIHHSRVKMIIFNIVYLIDMSKNLEFLNNLKIKNNPNAKQINGIYVRLNNNENSINNQKNNFDQSKRDIFIGRINTTGMLNVVHDCIDDVHKNENASDDNLDDVHKNDNASDDNLDDVHKNDNASDDNLDDVHKNDNASDDNLDDADKKNDFPNDIINNKVSNNVAEENTSKDLVVGDNVKTKKIRIKKDVPKKVDDTLINKQYTQPTDNTVQYKKHNVMIKTQNYYMNNRKQFIDNISKMLNHYKTEIDGNKGVISCKNQGNGEFKKLIHQKVVLDYLNLDTPYRGLLLYHGLGSGKTCTAIAIAEGMKSSSKVIVMTPASLQMNFVSELKKCGDPLYKKIQFWEFVPFNDDKIKNLSSSLSVPMDYITKKKGIWNGTATKDSNYSLLNEVQQKQIDAQLKIMIQSKYTNLNYNGGIKPKILKELSNDYTVNPFDDSVVIIDEAHNFVSRIVNKLPKKINVKGKNDGQDKFNKTISGRLYNYLMEASNVRIVLLTGTPIINYPNEIGILFNIIRGTTKTWTFDIDIGTTKRIDRDSILDMLDREGFTAHDFVSYSGNKLTVTRNPNGFINKKQILKKNTNVGGTKRMIRTTNNSTRKASSKNDNEYIILPQMQYKSDHNDDLLKGGDSEAFAGYSGVVFNPNSRITDAVFISRIKDILQKNDINIIDSQVTLHKCLPDISETFNNTFINSELGTLNNEDLFKRRILGLTSYFRSAQENLLPSYEMSDTGNIYHIVLCEMSDFQFGVYEKIRKAEDESEKNKRKNAGLNKGKKDEDILTIPSTYRIFSRACCNFAFPDEIGRPRPDKLEIGDEQQDEQDMELLQMKNDKEFDDDREDDDDDDQNEDNVEGLVRRKMMKGKQLDVSSDHYQKRIIDSMEKLRSVEYLSSSGLSTLSPKFSKILENIIDVKNVGLHLLYSNFRTIEGVGILKLILEINGYAEFKIKKMSNSSWDIVENKDDILKPKFVLYTGTESAEEKEIIRNIYNSTWELVPATISNKLHKKSPDNKNLYGDIIKLLMITSSGAEGINLKNTRYVHVVEPYWHMVRVQQVIGRARRICSHEELPIQLQTIKVFIYISTFSEKQKLDDKHIELRLRDTSKKDNITPITTDESLFEIAEQKDSINQQLLKAVKSSAIDCKLYNKGKEKYLCYSIGKVDNNNFLSIPDISIDQNNTNAVDQNFRQVTKFKLQLFNVPSKDGNSTYYLDTNSNEIFDVNDVNDAKAIDDYDNLKSIGNLKKDNNNNFKITFYKSDS
jgi:Type III restriction enzyme, res subunit